MRWPMDAPVLAKLTNKHLMLLWVVIPACLFIFSLVVIAIIAQHALEKRAGNDILSTVKFIDTILDDASGTAEDALALLGRPCGEVVEQLRMMGVKNTMVRTVNLIHDDEVYCGTVPLTTHRQLIPHSASDSSSLPSIHFRSGTRLFPNLAVIILHKYRGNDGVSAIIDTQYMSYMMNIVGTDNQVMVIIGDQFLSPLGKLAPVSAMAKEYIAVSGHSHKYPYKLQVNISRHRFIDDLIDTYGVIVLFSVVVSIVTSLLIRNWLKTLTSIRSSMAQGLKRNEFEAFFQPVMDAGNDCCTGVEILARWNHPTDGVVSPEVFIPLAEESGLIVPLTRQLMRQVAEVVAKTPVYWRENLHIAVNISAIHLLNRRIVDDCREFLRSVQGKNVQLLLELTERQSIEINDVTLEVLSALQEIGVRIGIDDFGTGYSGLSYLSKMNIDFLKLDKSFIAMIELESATKIIVDVVIDLAQKLNMQVIAEGVEHLHQKQYLLDKKVIFQQGFLFSKPLPIAQFQHYFNQTN
ncbi:EAL domain-containing protein [Sodalis sp. dw_96]|uniref:EAL domain-containing protein n=1 Tax=Sodalis sp. dw_96 TaxID=2719794 RepID=UPI001BD607A4|nr:EAL domain-containing protein [Sodalis sp. dw_96]